MKTIRLFMAVTAGLLLSGCGNQKELAALKHTADSLSSEIGRFELLVNRTIYDDYLSELETGRTAIQLADLESSDIPAKTYYETSDSLKRLHAEFLDEREKIADILGHNPDYQALRKKYVPVMDTPSMKEQYDRLLEKLSGRLCKTDPVFCAAFERRIRLQEQIAPMLLRTALADYAGRGECLPTDPVPSAVYAEIVKRPGVVALNGQLALLRKKLVDVQASIAASDDRMK